MKNRATIQILLFIVFINRVNATEFQRSDDSTYTSKKFLISTDIFKLPTLIKFPFIYPKEDVTMKADLMFRYYPKNELFVSSNIGYGKSYKMFGHGNSALTKGVYGQLGLGLDFKNYSQDNSFLIGYNMGLLTYNRKDYVKYKDDAWDEEVEKVFVTNDFNLYHEVFLGYKGVINIEDKVSVFLEIDTRLTFALSKVSYLDNRQFFPGYGTYSADFPLFYAITLHGGILF